MSADNNTKKVTRRKSTAKKSVNASSQPVNSNIEETTRSFLASFQEDNTKPVPPPLKRNTRSPSPKHAKEEVQENESIFTLYNLNVSELDRQYALPEIARKQERESKRNKDEELKKLTTSLTKLGISSSRKQPHEIIWWGDHYGINLWLSEDKNNEDIRVLTPSTRLRCAWCHNWPRELSLMVPVPYCYEPAYVEEHVHSPECVNVVEKIQVEPGKEASKKADPKNEPKILYFRRSLLEEEAEERKKAGKKVSAPIFKCVYPCCNFNCAEAKAIELSKKGVQFQESRLLLRRLYKLVFGEERNILPSPDPYLLQDYGGPLTLEEYREKALELKIGSLSQFWNTHRLVIDNRLYCSSETS